MMGIYCIYNKVSKKIYIGSSFDIKKRWVAHKSDLRTRRSNNSYLQRAWDKYGEDSFEFKILETVNDKEVLYQREQYWMDKTSCYNRSIGYNICESACGHEVSEESKQKLKRSLLSSDKLLRGEKHPRAVLTEGLVRFILKLYIDNIQCWGLTGRISRFFDISRPCVEHIVYRRSWKKVIPFSEREFSDFVETNNIDLDYLLVYRKSHQKQHSKNKLTESEARFVLSLYTYCDYDVAFYRDLAKKYNVTYENFGHIRRRSGWKHLTPYPPNQLRLMLQERGILYIESKNCKAV